MSLFKGVMFTETDPAAPPDPTRNRDDFGATFGNHTASGRVFRDAWDTADDKSAATPRDSEDAGSAERCDSGDA